MNESLDPTRWALVQARFHDVLTLPVGERSVRLAALAREDPALAAEVRSLLAAHDEGPLSGASDALPEFVGPYRLIRPIGEGGMGTVYLAEREGPGFRQRVALKLVRAGFLDPRLGRRFAEERRILARLEHPGIARLIDAGTTPGGQPYLAMEFVAGRSLLAHADRERLPVEARVRLFIEVCEAVHYAHQELVVHRDLKPGNILVGPDGRPRLLDFGIAKLLDPSAEGEGATRTLPWMTPAYASPEQVRGGRVGIPTDVYALGVLLYELLTDERPYIVAGATPAAVERIVCEGPVPRPSEKAADPRRARRLRGDLDLIVLKAMAKDPARRYGSAEALAEDLRRHLDGRPVLARPDTLLYRAGKFAGRHRTGVLFGAIAALSLVAGLVATAWQARRASHEARLATAEARKAERVSALLVDLFRLSDPSQALGDTVTAREMLDRGVARVEREFGDEPEVQAALLGEVAKVYANLGMLPRAEELLRRALDLRERLEGPTGAGVAAGLGQLGHVLATAGRRPEAIATFRRAIATREALVDGPDSALAADRAALAWELRAAGEGEEAAALFDRALADQRALFGRGWPPAAATLLGLAATLHDRGVFDSAEALYERALAETDTTRPHPVAADALLQVGMIRRLRAEYREAEPLIRAGRAMRHAIYEADHPDRVAADLEHGMILVELGRLGEAEPVLRSVLERARAALGGRHPTTMTAGETLALLLTITGRYGEAAAWYDSSITAKRGVHGGDHPQVVFALLRSGESLAQAGRLAEAARRLAEAAAMGERVSGTRSVSRMLVEQARAEIALREGRLADATQLLDSAEALGREILRPGHRYLRSLTLDRARLLARSGEPRAALEALRPVVAAYRAALPSPHPKTGVALVRVAEAELAAGNRVAAAGAARLALREFTALPASHPDVVEARRLLAAAE